ncbi:putative Response regulatory domain-containing protein [Rubrivivax sp. A210]|uniref:hypothetical protein n=1 Tax=Rubrivivax sp. A210 TaxID=2772301 RepID=UPI00191804A1|nr:hypothetical protein [Rubrivivax sp. A210]CAD5373795.1 putative Response regulatory domain-containing protein [Rubrivivax sp. A210]
MIINLCLACRKVNAPEALACEACGARLDDFVTQPMPLQPRRQPPNHGSIWLEDLAAPRPREAGASELHITLRNVKVPEPVPPEQRGVDGPLVTDVDLPMRFASAPVATLAVPVAVVAVAAEVPAAKPPLPPAAPPSELSFDFITDLAARRARKVERRASVRRARLASLSQDQGHRDGPSAVEVLVMDADEQARLLLGVLLQRFGFVVRVTGDPALASGLARSRPIVAAFVGIAPEDGNDPGLGVCRELHEIARARTGSRLLLTGVASHARPIDRVHADLAGCDEMIVKPVTRGAVARVLDEHGIALPTDARRA